MGLRLKFILIRISLLLLIRFRPGSNGVGMGLYHIPSQSSGGGSSPCARHTERSAGTVLIGCRTDGFIRLRPWNGWLIASFPFLSFPTLVRGYSAQEVCTK